MGRLRTNTAAPELIKDFPNYINLEDFKFPKQKLYLEIGCGKGDFLIEQAVKNPSVYFLGIEKYSTVILKALKKIQRNNLQLNNLVFACADAEYIDIDKFKNKISKIFLNFSDPWPKKRHTKRRLTSPKFLDIYRKILKNIATIEFKTDNTGLYEYTMETIKQQKDIKILYFTSDLYKNINNKFNLNNVQTEYEKKFIIGGKTINKIVWKFII